jgi:hypothetical protein
VSRQQHEAKHQHDDRHQEQEETQNRDEWGLLALAGTFDLVEMVCLRLDLWIGRSAAANVLR